VTKEFVFAGFGGQGVLTAGMILAYSGAAKDLDVTWIPAYGSEMRGGTANCTVKIGDEEVASPFTAAPDVLIAMNEPSLIKFMNIVKKGGSIIANSSIIANIPQIKDVNVYAVPVNTIAEELKNARSANICALGAAIAVAGDILTLEDVERGLCGYLSKVKDNSSNIAVLRAGYSYSNMLDSSLSTSKNALADRER
jgi:2-oxoglutarate ferredoxin oxidoreductase subunit gamma